MNIKQLDEWARINNRSIKVNNGKECGISSEDYAVGELK